MIAIKPIILRVAVALLAVGALVAANPVMSDAAKKKKCTRLKEATGCKLKSGAYKGITTNTGLTYGVVFTINDDAGGSLVRGAVRVTCTGGNPQAVPITLAPVLQTLLLPKTVTIGKKYSKSGHLDMIGNTGQTKVRVVADESVSIKILSAKKARVSISVNQSRQTVEPASSETPFVCVGSGTEDLRRSY